MGAWGREGDAGTRGRGMAALLRPVEEPAPAVLPTVTARRRAPRPWKLAGPTGGSQAVGST